MMTPIVMKGNDYSFDSLQDGFVVLINKEKDWTSFDVCKKIRGIVSQKKVGHAGTLDPMATGLLLVGVGKGTKMLTELMGKFKSYSAVIQFGLATDTYDLTGMVLEKTDSIDLDESGIKNTLEAMRGEILQMPPMFSAKKVAGNALYKYARKGLVVERKAVKVTISHCEFEYWQPPFLGITLNVSKGTYIRSFAHDLGESLGIPACLAQLHRLAIDKYDVRDSMTIEEFSAFWKGIAA